MSARNKEKIDVLGKSNMEIYEMVLEGRISRFPIGFWSKNVAREIVLEIYKDYTRNQLANLNFRKDLKEKRLIYIYQLFDYSTIKLLSYCFPELKIKEWELKVVPEGCWKNKDNVRDAVRNAFKKEGIRKKEKICVTFSADFLREHGLRGIMKEYTLYEIITIAYPEYDIIEKDLNKQYHWEKDAAIKNIRHMIENILKWEYKDICENISTKTFIENGLGGLLTKVCHNSVYEALELAYPGKFQKENLKSYNMKLSFGRIETPIF